MTGTAEVVARLIGVLAVQANGEPFPTLAAYMEVAPVVLLWDDGSVTWARQVAIPDTAAPVVPGA